MPASAAGQEYAKLPEMSRDKRHYSELTGSSRPSFDERSNLDAWALFWRTAPRVLISGRNGKS